jgi:NitT/TauT family transport system ATP-binding protein
MRESDRYLLLRGGSVSRPEPVQAAWLYAQMVRWGQAVMTPGALGTAMAVFRPDLYDAAFGRPADSPAAAAHAIGAFAGPPFDPADVPGHLAAFEIGRWRP